MGSTKFRLFAWSNYFLLFSMIVSVRFRLPFFPPGFLIAFVPVGPYGPPYMLLPLRQPFLDIAT
ncbi:hypothetical protein EDB87DRAFT_1600997 [Lactarius vividus]|nr:hypothetical protein EDB87DRAFT_1600997 [Lactarius vividus]